MTAQSTNASVLKDFAARSAFLVLDAETADVSSAHALPTRTDSEGVALVPIGFHVGVAGNVKITTLAGTDVTLTFGAGDWPWPISKIHKVADGTTATGLAFLYGTRRT